MIPRRDLISRSARSSPTFTHSVLRLISGDAVVWGMVRLSDVGARAVQRTQRVGKRQAKAKIRGRASSLKPKLNLLALQEHRQPPAP